MFRKDAAEKIRSELEHGEEARRSGFEGRARVCARRAAGMAVREYLSLRNSEALPGAASAYDLLGVLRDLPEVSAEIRQAVDRLTERVDSDFHLPENYDLLADARWLAQALENASGDGLKDNNRSEHR